VKLGTIVRLPKIDSFQLSADTAGNGEFYGDLKGQGLETIAKVGWDAAAGIPVEAIPAPVAGGGTGQILRVAVPWPAPAPHCPLYGSGVKIRDAPLPCAGESEFFFDAFEPALVRFGDAGKGADVFGVLIRRHDQGVDALGLPSSACRCDSASMCAAISSTVSASAWWRSAIFSSLLTAIQLWSTGLTAGNRWAKAPRFRPDTRRSISAPAGN
jgi:hypothetical protein